MSSQQAEYKVTADPPEPDLTPEEMVGRARALVPTLIERQADTEQRTFHSPETFQAFDEAGFYRILHPRRYGGYEFDITTFFQVVLEIARGCPSSGWMFCLGATHTITVASYFSEQAQIDVLGSGHFICPATLKPQGTARRADDGGWIIDGTFNYCSGAPYATHFMGHALIAPEPGDDSGIPRPLLFIIGADQFERLDDWGSTLGLKGSGSHSIRIAEGYVPAHLAMENETFLTLDPSRGTVGAQLHRNPMYRGSTLSLYMLEPAVISVGMAQAACDEYHDLMGKKTLPLPPFTVRTQDPDYQRWYGKGVGQVLTAQLAAEAYARKWMDLCERDAFSVEEDLQFGLVTREILNLSWNAVQDNFFRTAGSGEVRNGARMERIWRDMSQLHSHTGFALIGQLAAPALARLKFGMGGDAWSPSFDDQAAVL